MHDNIDNCGSILDRCLYTWFERVSMSVILLNCLTLGLYKPCTDEVCATVRCRVLLVFDHLIFVFFAVEMLVKMTAMGVVGKKAYLAETWNRLDMFIVFAGFVAILLFKKKLC